MKATGIVRHIDGLGRIVIPKEIRRILRIREGDPLEIFVESDNKIILSKYSHIDETEHSASHMSNLLNKLLGLPIVVCGKDNVLACTGIAKKELVGKLVSDSFLSVMDKRQGYIATESGHILFDGLSYTVLCAYPVISDGNVCGSVCVLNSSESGKFTESDRKLISLCAMFLSKEASD